MRFHAHRGSRPLRTSAGGLQHSIDAFRSRESPTSIIFCRFLPWLGRPPTERRSSRPAPASMSLVRCLYNRCVIARCGFGDLACDSVREGRAGGHRPLVAVRASTVGVSIETIRKYRIETVSCRETSITNACYLCNTLWKTGGLRSLEAVPLLRVQKSSVIVIKRRRGASRGRPVLGGSLKSLAFMRECPKARSD
jgi:hypothetical protein